MKDKAGITPAVLLLTIFAVLISCKQQKTEWQGTIEEVDGITVVKNPKEPMYGEEVFSLEEELSIGEVAGTEEYMFSRIDDIAVDDEENIYILDSKQTHIKTFNRDGEYLKSIGRKGQGPGELQYPVNLTISPMNEILINDYARCLSIFSIDGNFLRAVSLTTMRMISKPKADSRGNIVASYMVFGEEALLVLKKFNSDLEEMYAIFSTEVLKYPYLNPYYPHCYWEITKDDNIIWGFPTKYELQVLSPEGNLIKRIVKDYKPVKITNEEKETLINEKMGGYENIPPEVKIQWDEFHNAFIYLTVDDFGRIFVRTFEKVIEGNDYYYDVFNSEGKYIAKIPLKARPRVWKRNQLYTIEEDEEGYQVVKRYKVNWKI